LARDVAADRDDWTKSENLQWASSCTMTVVYRAFETRRTAATALPHLESRAWLVWRTVRQNSRETGRRLAGL